MNISSYISTPKKGQEKEATQIFRILANPARFRILKLLFCNKRKEICVKEIAQAARLSQSATSHQLALLEARGVVRGERMGQTVCYFLADSSLTKTITKIMKIIC